jgi:hypothetical protein
MKSLQKFVHAANVASHIAIDPLFQVDLPILLTDRRSMVFHRLQLENVSLTMMRFRLGLIITLFSIAIFLASISASANPYLAKPGEAPTPVYAATCATNGGFIHMYTALDQNLFAKYGISVKHVVIRTGTNINLAVLRISPRQEGQLQLLIHDFRLRPIHISAADFASQVAAKKSSRRLAQ